MAEVADRRRAAVRDFVASDQEYRSEVLGRRLPLIMEVLAAREALDRCHHAMVLPDHPGTPQATRPHVTLRVIHPAERLYAFTDGVYAELDPDTYEGRGPSVTLEAVVKERYVEHMALQYPPGCCGRDYTTRAPVRWRLETMMAAAAAAAAAAVQS